MLRRLRNKSEEDQMLLAVSGVKVHHQLFVTIRLMAACISALHREVPLPHEVVGLGNFVPRIADNAEALIDYALSHIPPSKSSVLSCTSRNPSHRNSLHRGWT